MNEIHVKMIGFHLLDVSPPSASRDSQAMSTAYTMQTAPKALFDYDKYWASCFEPAPFCRCHEKKWTNSAGMRVTLFLVCGDAYIDHPSFVSGVIGRVLEAQGFRVGIIAQPDWTNVESFRVLGKPTIAWE